MTESRPTPAERWALALAAAFVALLPFGWSILPWNMQVGDLLFPIAIVAMVVAGWRLGPHPLDLFVAAFVVSSLPSVFGSHSPRTSALGIAKEIYVAGIYLLAAAAASRHGAVRVCRWLAWSAGALSAVSLLAALAFYASGATWRLFGEPMPLPYVGTVFRTQGSLHAPEFFGNLLTFVVPLLLVGPLWSRHRRSPRAALLGVVALAEVLTFSKSLGGFAVAATMALWPACKTRPIIRGAMGVAALMLVLGFNLSAWVAIRKVDVSLGTDASVAPPPYAYVRQDGANGADTIAVRIAYNPMSYYLVKKVEWTAFRAHPWAGIGLNAFPFEAERAFDQGRLYSPYQHINAHSTPFGRLAETGLIGAIPLAVFVAAFLVLGARAAETASGDRVVAWAVLAGSIGLFVNSINVDMMNFRFFWFGAGIIRAMTARQKS